jgi:hypothetical protein
MVSVRPEFFVETLPRHIAGRNASGVRLGLIVRRTLADASDEQRAGRCEQGGKEQNAKSPNGLQTWALAHNWLLLKL